ncbi:MAG: 2-oxo acid dehydrogenase subunit E2, partial [Clostridia bacterium]|nr:2-oxo acid dehydrogenase subunit E2 [Clostridia bacterium]
RFFTKFPGLLFKFTVAFLRFLDYFSLMPKFIAKVSPYHCSYFITSMGSLGIPPIYHHLYDFGTCPVFFSFGAKRRAYELDSQGIVKKKSYMDFTFVLDERICDGYYYASALRHLKNIIKNPWQLDNPPETVVEDIE